MNTKCETLSVLRCKSKKKKGKKRAKLHKTGIAQKSKTKHNKSMNSSLHMKIKWFPPPPEKQQQ